MKVFEVFLLVTFSRALAARFSPLANEVWIGANQPGMVENNWVWSDGITTLQSTMNYFVMGQPDAATSASADHLTIFLSSGLVDDRDALGRGSALGYLCERAYSTIS